MKRVYVEDPDYVPGPVYTCKGSDLSPKPGERVYRIKHYSNGELCDIFETETGKEMHRLLIMYHGERTARILMSRVHRNDNAKSY